MFYKSKNYKNNKATQKDHKKINGKRNHRSRCGLFV